MLPENLAHDWGKYDLIKPWLATFLFGCGVFLVGLWLQRKERAKRRKDGR